MISNSNCSDVITHYKVSKALFWIYLWFAMALILAVERNWVCDLASDLVSSNQNRCRAGLSNWVLVADYFSWNSFPGSDGQNPSSGYIIRLAVFCADFPAKLWRLVASYFTRIHLCWRKKVKRNEKKLAEMWKCYPKFLQRLEKVLINRGIHPVDLWFRCHINPEIVPKLVPVDASPLKSKTVLLLVGL